MLQKCKVNFAEVLKNKKISVQSKDIYEKMCELVRNFSGGFKMLLMYSIKSFQVNCY